MDSPSILWLSLESVRADHTSLYGYHRPTTPYLESLSQRPDAVRLDPMISASMWTPASTASMLTGTHLSTHQLGQDGKANHPLRTSIETLPRLLSTNGYQTALFSTNPYVGSDTGLDRGFDHVENASLSDIGRLSRNYVRIALESLLSSPTLSLEDLKKEIVGRANDVLEYRVSRWLDHDLDPDEPFFAYAHVQSPHHPYQPSKKFLTDLSPGIDGNVSEALERVGEIYDGSDAIKRRMHDGLGFSEETWTWIRDLYDAEIRYADHTVERIVRKAEAESRGPLVVIIAGDHGELFGEYGLIGHNLVLHDGVTRVPGLVVGIEGATDPDGAVTQHVDLTRTVASMAGVVTEQFQGRDLRDPDRPYAVSQRGVAHLDEYTKYGESFDTSNFFEDPFTSVRSAEYKLLSNESRTVLYRLPDEQTDVSEQETEKVSELLSSLDREGIGWTGHETERIEYDASTAKRLRGLGYLE